MNFITCKQMREQGLSENEIKNHVQFYDLDF